MSTIEVNKIAPVSGGTAVTMGDSGDTFTVTSGATLNASSSNLANRANAKPLMINGDMAVAQRETSNTNFSNGTIVVDRIQGIANGLGSSGSVLTGSQVSDGPTGFEKSFKLEVTSAGGLDSADNRFAIETKLEHQDVSKFFDNNAMTLSFYVKSSLADTFAVGISRNNQNTSSGGNLYIANYTISSANTWQQVVINIPTDSTTTGETANATGVALEWFIDVKSGGSRTGASLGWNDTTTQVQINSAAADNGFFNATNTWFITGVQLEVGTYTSATLPLFQHESFGDNLARCQRYLEFSSDYGADYTSGVNSCVIMDMGGSHPIYVPMSYNVYKRAAPTMTFYNGNSGATGTWRTNASTDVSISGTSISSQGFSTNSADLGGDGRSSNGTWKAESEL